MKNEQELLTMLRSALDDHEKAPFDQIRNAVSERRAQPTPQPLRQKEPQKKRRRVYTRQIALVAVWLMIVAGIGIVFHSSFNRMNETAYYSETPVASQNEPEEFAVEGAPEDTEGVYDAATLDDSSDLFNDTGNGGLGGSTGAFPLSEALQRQMELYAGQPDHIFAVMVVLPEGESGNESLRTKAVVQHLTADEIWELAARGASMDLAGDASSSNG